MPITCAPELATARDAARIALLSRNLIEHGLPWSWTPSRIRRCMAHPDYVVLAARVGRQLAGFGVMHYLDRHAHLCLLGVAPAYQRQELGKNLLQWLEATARVAGVFKIILEVRESNSAAARFYQQAGYTQVRLLPAYYAPAEHAIRLRRNLAVTPS